MENNTKTTKREEAIIREEMYKEVFNSKINVTLKFKLVDLMYELSEAAYERGIGQGIVIMKNTYKL